LLGRDLWQENSKFNADFGGRFAHNSSGLPDHVTVVSGLAGRHGLRLARRAKIHRKGKVLVVSRRSPSKTYPKL
jgi:hypothetical protein